MEITIEKLKDYAGKLMFDMDEKEYETLKNEFNIILKQMELFDKFDNIKDVEPMTFPFPIDTQLREDVSKDNLEIEDVLKNAKEVIGREIRVPKVVE